MANVKTKSTGVESRPTTTWGILDAAADLIENYGHPRYVAPRLREQAYDAEDAIRMAATGTRNGRRQPWSSAHDRALRAALDAIVACDNHIGSLSDWEFHRAESDAEIVELLRYIAETTREVAAQEAAEHEAAWAVREARHVRLGLVVAS